MDFWQTEYTASMGNMFLMLYPVLGLLVAKGGRWGTEMQREFPPMLAKSAKMGKICTQWSQFRRDFWQTEYTEFMEDMFLMLYPVLGLLRAKGGRWDAEMKGPNVRKLPEGGSVCPLRTHIWGDFRPTKWTESMKSKFLMLYPVLESLRANGGRWGAEMQRVIPPNVGISPQGDISIHQGVSSGAISGQQSIQNPWRTCY